MAESDRGGSEGDARSARSTAEPSSELFGESGCMEMRRMND